MKIELKYFFIRLYLRLFTDAYLFRMHFGIPIYSTGSWIASEIPKVCLGNNQFITLKDYKKHVMRE